MVTAGYKNQPNLLKEVTIVREKFLLVAVTVALVLDVRTRYVGVTVTSYSFRAMWMNNDEENAFRTICKAISECHHHFKISDFA